MIRYSAEQDAFPVGSRPILRIKVTPTDMGSVTFNPIFIHPVSNLAFVRFDNGEKIYPEFVANDITIIGSCCNGIRGNVDSDNQDVVDISDLVQFVSYMFDIPPGPGPECWIEADIDNSGEVDIADLVWLVEYSFSIPPGPAPLDCY